MNPVSRIPKLSTVSFDDALQWLSEMQCRGLFFHPDDDPADIVVIRNGEKMFRNRETEEVQFVPDELFTALGDGVYEAAYPIMMNACGIRLDA